MADSRSVGAKFDFLFQEPEGAIAFLGSILILLTYYSFVFKRNRNMPGAQLSFVMRPPFSLSPAAMRFIALMGYDTKCLTAGIINASIKGCYHIRWGRNGFLARQTEDPDWDQLSNDEKSALSYRKEHYWPTIKVGGTISSKARKMGDRMDTYLTQRYGNLFDRKSKWIWIGCLISLSLCLLIFALAEGDRTIQNFLGYAIAACVSILLPIYFLGISIGDRYWFGIILSVTWIVIGISLVVMLESNPGTPMYSIVFFPIVVINYVFYRISPTYTPYGKFVMEQIIGYKLYLLNRFSGSQPVAKGDDQIVHELPYAIAMDIDSARTSFFKLILSRQRYQPFNMWNTLLNT